MFESLFLQTLIVSIFLTNLSFALPKPLPERSEFDSINGLYELQSLNHLPIQTGRLQLQFFELEDMLPSFDARQSFQQDWLRSLVSLARETADHIETKELILPKANPRLSSWRESEMGVFVLSADKRMIELLKSGSYSLPLRHAMLRLTDSQWSDFLASYKNVLSLSQTQMNRIFETHRLRAASPAAFFAMSMLNDQDLILNWNFEDNVKVPNQLIERQQLRALDLVELVLQNSFYPPKFIKNWILKNFLNGPKNSSSHFSPLVQLKMARLDRFFTGKQLKFIRTTSESSIHAAANICSVIFK